MPVSRGVKWKESTYYDKPITCEDCHKAILPGQIYRWSKSDKCFIHKNCERPAER